MTSALMYGFNELGNGKTLGVTTDATQNALSTMYESMKPDVTQMQGLIDDYREAGKAVPQSLMDSFNDAIEVGAAAGDTSATWQNYANQIWKNGSDELKASLTDPSNPMYETVRSQLPPELAEAIDRAAAETTTDDVTLEGLKASVDGDVDIDKDAWTSKLNEALGDLGETQEVTNPSASISTSSSGSSVSATIAGHASGGEVGLNGAELSWVGEEGLEYIIPTVPARRQRGIELWKSAGRTLGVLGPDDEISAHASGGIVGKEVSNTTPYFDTDSSSQDSEKSEKETVPTNVVSDKSGVVVQVNLSPQFNISDE